MGHQSAEQIAQRALDLGLLDDRQLREIWANLGSHNVPMDDLLQMLVRREFLTNYQVERLVNGERSGFFFGSYKVLYLVGAGSFARVFRAADQKTGRRGGLESAADALQRQPQAVHPVPARRPRGQYAAASEHRPHLRRRFRAAASFPGDGIRRGLEPADFVKVRKTIEPLQTIKLMTDMTEGLRYAFEHGVTHRDLKLNNVLVSSVGQAKLVDFGLAAIDEAIADDAMADVPNTRTIDYAALERATGVRKDDTRSDIFFLGCIFYHMLTGQAPLSETRDPLQRLSKQRFLDVIPIQNGDPRAALGHPGGQQGDVAGPDRRYQSPFGDAGRSAPGRPAIGGQGRRRRVADDSGIGREGLSGSGQQHTVMIVESNQKMQDILPRGLQAAGYRVLLTSDPSRRRWPVAPRQRGGRLRAVRRRGARPAGPGMVQPPGRRPQGRRAIRTVLLLGENQRDWRQDAQVSEFRKVLVMPLTMRQLRAALVNLLGTKTAK